LPKAAAAQEGYARIAIGDGLTQQILAGDAKVGFAALEELGDLRRGDKIDLNARQFGDVGLVAARRARFGNDEPGLGQCRVALVLEAALRGQREDELAAHDALPSSAASRRSV